LDVIVEELPTHPTDPKVEMINEAELELVCEGPPPLKNAPMVVDLTQSCDIEEDSARDSDTLMRIKGRMLSRQRSLGSQSSCPADENATHISAPVTLSRKMNKVTGSSNSSLISSTSNIPPLDQLKPLNWRQGWFIPNLALIWMTYSLQKKKNSIILIA
jgi:hypothetical protein